MRSMREKLEFLIGEWEMSETGTDWRKDFDLN